MYRLDIEEILNLLRTATVEEDWAVIDETIDKIQKALNEETFRQTELE